MNIGDIFGKLWSDSGFSTILNGFFSDVFYSLGWSRRSTPGGDRVMLRHPEGFEA